MPPAPARVEGHRGRGCLRNPVEFGPGCRRQWLRWGGQKKAAKPGQVCGTFYMRHMTTLRMLALCSNFAFILYGLGLGLAPIWLLHALLLPVNAWRPWQDVSMRWPRVARQPAARFRPPYAVLIFPRKSGQG